MRRIIIFAILAFMTVFPASASVARSVSSNPLQTPFVRIVLKSGQQISDAQKEIIRSYVEACNSRVTANSPEIARILSTESQAARFVTSIIRITCASEAFRNVKELSDSAPP